MNGGVGVSVKIAKKYQPYLKVALAHGARLEKGSKHLKVYNGPRLLITISYGKQFEGAGDLALLKRVWREQGWL